MDPVTLSLIGTGIGGLTGFFGGKARAAEARRVENMNRELSAADTMFNPLVKTSAYKTAVPDAGPGAFGGALSGGLAGFNQAQAFSGSNIYKDMLKKRAGSPTGSQELSSLMG